MFDPRLSDSQKESWGCIQIDSFSQSGCTAKEDGDGGGDEADNLEAQKDDGGEGKGDV